MLYDSSKAILNTIWEIHLMLYIIHVPVMTFNNFNRNTQFMIQFEFAF